MHLAAAPLLADYEPLVQGAQWIYNDVDDGKRSTETETISPQMKRMHGQWVFEQVTDYSDGTQSRDYMNYSASHQLQLHRSVDADSDIGFSPPLLFPLRAIAGQRIVSDGKVDAILFSISMTGRYHNVTEVLGKERVTVPAGTFSTIKVRTTGEFTVEYHKRGVNVSMKMSGTSIDWVAKGVGSVKSNSVNHIEATVNNKHKKGDTKSRSTLKSYSIPV